jgi:hypothetical protein
MPIPQNLTGLHMLEEDLRARSLRCINSSEELSDHLESLHDAMDHLTVLIRVGTAPGSRQHTLQLLAIRLLNNAASVLKLGLSGYYQVGFQLIREMLELVNLVDLFSVEPDKIDVWRTADDKTHKEVFYPVKVRQALEKHPRFSGHRRDGLYKTFSNYAAHPTYKGFQLIAPGNTPQIGAFFDEQLLGALLYEAGRHLPHATISLSLVFGEVDESVLLAKAAYVNQLRRYHDKYVQVK